MLHGAVGRGCVGVDHKRQSRDSRCARWSHRQAPHGKVAPPHEPDRAIECDETVLQEDRYGLRRRHAEMSGAAGSPSMGSEREPPGGIMGNTLASCSIMNSTREGPGSAMAARTTSSSWSADSTFQPAIPYACARRT